MSLAHKISAWNRKRKYALFLELLAPTHDTKVLDVGYANVEHSPSDNYLEKHYPHPENLTALGITPPTQFLETYPRVKAVQYDGKRFPFEDNSFDICWTNAVIEHVGDAGAQRLFLQEIKRVAKRAFITTPHRFFPIEVHTRTPLLHYLPKPWFDTYLQWVGKSWAAGSYMRLLSIPEMRRLLAAADISSFTIHKNRLLGFTVDFIVTL